MVSNVHLNQEMNDTDRKKIIIIHNRAIHILKKVFHDLDHLLVGLYFLWEERDEEVKSFLDIIKNFKVDKILL